MFFNKKIGFTLAEILIALGIVGIVSVIVTPGIVETGRKAKYGATLGKVVYQIELGAQNYIQDYNDKQTNGSYAQDLTGLGSGYDNKTLAEYAGATYNMLKNSYRPKNYDGSDATTTLTDMCLYSFSKLDAQFWIKRTRGNKGFEDNQTVVIDVNGYSNNPNAYGKDLFSFILDKSGKLIPNDDKTKKVVQDGFKINY